LELSLKELSSHVSFFVFCFRIFQGGRQVWRVVRQKTPFKKNRWAAHIKSIPYISAITELHNLILNSVYFEELKIWKRNWKLHNLCLFILSPLGIRKEIEDHFVLLSSYFVPFGLIYEALNTVIFIYIYIYIYIYSSSEWCSNI
jgi:hypothetical protein